MRRVRRWICVMFTTAAAACAQHYPIMLVPGSPHGIYTMVQDSHSALWMGTIDDVLRFDGQNFYSIRQYGFPNERAQSLAEDSDGGIWIATLTVNSQKGVVNGGIYRYQNGKVEKILSDPSMSVVNAGPNTMLATITRTDSLDYGDLYIFRKDQNGWRTTRVLESDAKLLTVDHRGSALFPCRAGTCELSRLQILEWPHSPLVPKSMKGPGGTYLRVLRDRFDCLWFRGELAMTYQCPGGRGGGILDSAVGLDDSATLSEMEDGSVLTIGPGLALGRPEGMRFARAINGLPGGVNVAIAAQDGTVFLGTNTGLYRFMYPFRLEYWNQEDGVDNPFFVMRNGNRVFASNSGIKVLDPSRRRWEPWVDPGMVGTTVHLIPGPGDSIYAASLIRGVTQISRDGKLLARSNYGPGGARLAGDGHRHTWLAGTGITLVTKKRGRLELTPQGMGSGVSLDMEYDAKRNELWACHEREVVLFAENQWTHITAKDGLLDDHCRSIAVLPGAEVWVGYAHLDSLSRIRRNSSGTIQVDTFRYDSNSHNADYTFLDADSRGWLWWATGGRDYVAAPLAAAQGNWVALDSEDGIPVPGGNQNSFFGDTDGSIWFASENTVVHFTPPDDFATRFPQPPLFIGGFSFGSGGATLSDAIGQIPRDTDVVAHIGSLQFDRRNALRIRYRLLPERATWIYTSNLDPSLGKLRWGQYTLQVQAQLGNGPWSPVEEQSFRVLWPLWLSWPALLLLGTTCTGIGVGAVQWRRRRLFQSEMVLPDLAAWRMEALSPEIGRLIGTLINDRYEIGHILSVGGFATVARARDLHQGGQLCAIKIFRYELADQAWVRHRFAHEVAALQGLSHPNIVKITGQGVVDTGAPFLVMEFIHGRSLRELLEQGGLARKQIAVFLQQIASALQLLHQSMIFHRDLKPENLMIRSSESNEEQIVLIDFSIAIVKSADQTFHGISRVAGTLDYMAPEQVIGYADAGTDIYSLAKIVMEMLTGFRWTELFKAATHDLSDQIRGYFTTNRGIFKEDSIDLLVSALAFDPVHRPKDAREFAIPIVRDLEEAP